MLGQSWNACPERRITRQIKDLHIDDAATFGDVRVVRSGHHVYTLSGAGVWQKFSISRGDVSKLVRRVMALMEKPRTVQLSLFRDAS